MASPAPSASRPADPTSGVDSQSTTPAAPARPPCELIVVSTSDEFLLELGEALGGQASVRLVDSVTSALEHLGASRHAQLIALDVRSAPDLRAALEQLRARAPHTALLAFAEASAEQTTAAALKGSDVFALLPIPVDRGKTTAIFEGALAAAAARRAAARPTQKSYAEQVRPPAAPISVSAAPAPIATAGTPRKLPVVPIAAAAAGVLVLVAAGAWYLTRPAGSDSAADAARTSAKVPPGTVNEPKESATPAPIVAAPVSLVQGTVDELLEKARAAMRERRYTEPADDNALVYLRSALAVDASSAEARDGLARIGGVLVGRVEDAIKASSFDEAGAALASLKAALPEDSRVRPLEAKLIQTQLTRALNDGNFERATGVLRAAQASGAVAPDVLAGWRQDLARRQDDARVKRLVDLASERLRDGRLVEPANDSARLYVQQLRSAAPAAEPTQRLVKELTAAYLRKARESGLAGRTNESERWLGEARSAGVPAAEITALQRDIATSRQRVAAAEADRVAQLARERLKEGRLIEPSGDSAAHYLSQLQATDSSHDSLAPAGRELAARLLERAGSAAREGRAAQVDADLAAARRWGADARDIQAVRESTASAASAPKAAATPPRAPAVARNLKRVRYVAPEYPDKALDKGASGSVTVEFVVNTKGEPQDLRVSSSTPVGLFERAALAAVRRWRYEPLAVDGVPVEVPTRAVIRFEAPKE